MTEAGMDRKEFAEGLRSLGLREGNVVFIHASIRAIGHVEGGAQAVVDALLDVLGPEGTLAAPAFAFRHEIEVEPLIDPMHDRSEMGSITEAVRLLPGARVCVAYRHAVSAFGPRADWICGAPEDVSPFDRNGAFGRLLGLGSKVLLIGVAYTHCTCGHFAEFVNQVDYRRILLQPIRLVRPDGSIERTTVVDYQPKPTADGSYYHRPDDFNKAGALLEETGAVSVQPIGNAICRLFAIKDYMDLVGGHFRNGRNVLYFEDGQTDGTTLRDGVLVEEHYLCEADRDEVSMLSVVRPEDVHATRSGRMHREPVEGGHG
jgi:aminoglycoside 3-N-acetyltransferase